MHYYVRKQLILDHGIVYVPKNNEKRVFVLNNFYLFKSFFDFKIIQVDHGSSISLTHKNTHVCIQHHTLIFKIIYLNYISITFYQTKAYLNYSFFACIK